jgi:hypothetical protein
VGSTADKASGLANEVAGAKCWQTWSGPTSSRQKAPLKSQKATGDAKAAVKDATNEAAAAINKKLWSEFVLYSLALLWRGPIEGKMGLRRYKSAGASAAPNLHLENMLDEALRETFPASDPIAITIDQPPPLIAEAESKAMVDAGEQSLIGPFNAMLWGPIQFFNWGHSSFGGARPGKPDEASVAK